ncbi:MAG: Biopolymer transport protein ExbD/TolR [Phycisphaerales bacterium]|nr:Biopolymer transport protein ExbD/TolR [Phycisphaerales bacterium]
MKLDRNKTIHYDSGPDMTPLVDVVMVLLIFLMMVGKFGGADRYLASNLPITSAGVSNTQVDPNLIPKDPVTISVSPLPPSGFRAFVGRTSASNDEQLTAQLKTLLAGLKAAGRKPEDIQVFIKPAKQLRYDNVVTVYTATLQAGFTKIGFQAAE